MRSTRFTITIAALTCAAGMDALAQVPALQNVGFETALSELNDNGRRRALNWRHHNTARRRWNTDTATPPFIIRTGIASMDVAEDPAFPFSGFDCDTFNSGTFLYDMPIYDYACGPATFSLWYAVPATHPFVYKRLGLKWEIKRDQFSVYDYFEDLSFGPESNGGTGHTNGQWEQFVSTITQADFEYQFNFFNDLLPFDGIGEPWPDSNVIVMTNLVAVVYGPAPVPPETGHVFWDDAFYLQDLDGPGDSIEFWDDRFVKASATIPAGIPEAAIPIFLNGTQRGYACLAGNDTFKQIEVFDGVVATRPFSFTTGLFPLAWRETVVSGLATPYVQFVDGSSAGGTGVLTGPSLKPQGQPLDVAPTYSRADVTASIAATGRDLTADPQVLGTPIRTNNFKIQGTGNYGNSTLVSQRDYGMDPVVGTPTTSAVTTSTVTYTWTATSAITLDAGANGRGVDAFHLITLSSMLANLGLGQYDARFIAVESPTGDVRTLAIDDAPRNVYLYPSPQATAVGRSFWLYQDTGATTNPGSPTVEIELVSLSITGGVGSLGVNAFLASSTDPAVDSLTAWLEWVGAPAVIPSGTVISATFTVRATEATDVGDLDHDGDRDCADATLLVALCGQSESSATFNAYADMNGDGTINAADETALEAIIGSACPGSCAPPPCTGDADGNGTVNFADVTSVLANFGGPGPGGDADHNGMVNFADVTAILANFGSNCS
jgi:hypothetical protein